MEKIPTMNQSNYGHATKRSTLRYVPVTSRKSMTDSNKEKVGGSRFNILMDLDNEIGGRRGP